MYIYIISTLREMIKKKILTMSGKLLYLIVVIKPKSKKKIHNN